MFDLNTQSDKQNIILNDKELAKILDPTGKIITTWSLRRWRVECGMPAFLVGKRVFFRLESVLKWINERETSLSQPEPQQFGTLRKIK